MKAYLEIELFGDDVRQLSKICTNITNEIIPGLGDATFGGMPSSGWVAEITGFDPKYKYLRKFLKCKKEYSRSNSKGSRGIMAEYILESGRIYQVKSQTSWKNTDKYFCIVSDDGDIVKITEDTVSAKLKSLGIETYRQGLNRATTSSQTYYAALNMTVVGGLTDEQRKLISKRMDVDVSIITKHLRMLCERMSIDDLVESLQNGNFKYSSTNNTHHNLWKSFTEALDDYNYCADIVKVDKVKTKTLVKGVELWLKNRSESTSLLQQGNE